MDYGFTQKRKQIEEYKIEWERIKSTLNITEDTVVLVLGDENKRLDQLCLDYLPNYVLRKNAMRAEILIFNEELKKSAQNKKYGFPFRVTLLDGEVLQGIYYYYCFAFNLDNIAFTFLEQCPYNTLGRIIEETDITEDEAVCLGVYWLRELQGEMADV